MDHPVTSSSRRSTKSGKAALFCFAVALFSLPTGPVVAQKYNLFQTTLPNGLQVIVIENPIVPLVTIEINVRNGSYTEPPEYNGLSHLYEHMFFKANKSIPSQEAYLDRTRELGMSWNGTTSEERVNYYFTLSKDSLLQGLAFMEAAIETPLFLQTELEHERPVVTGEYDRAESNPFFQLTRAVDKKVWYKYFSRKNVLGDRSTILTATQEKMQTIQKRYYIPNNSALLVSGDVRHEEIFKLAGEYLGDWEKGTDPFVSLPVPEHPPIEKSETVIVEQPVNSIAIYLRMQGPSLLRDTKATYAADVFSFILGQKSSHFQQALVESGLCTNAGVSYYTLNHTGPITITAQMTADKFTNAREALTREMNKFLDHDYFTDEQLENAKTQLEISQEYGQETPSNDVHNVGFWWSIAGGLDYYLNYIDNLKKITREDLANYVSTYIHGAPVVEGILVSPEDRQKLSLR